MEQITEFVTIWGGIASIVTLCLTIVGGFIAFFRWGRKRRKREIEFLSHLRGTIEERVRSATTQGKRMDIFIYYQSLLSQLRFDHLTGQIHAAIMHIISILIMFHIVSLDANADYYIDHMMTGVSFDNYYQLIALIPVIVFLNVLLRIMVSREYKRIDEASNVLTVEFRKHIKPISRD